MDREQRERLAKLLSMLSSNHDGEVFNAARLVVRFGNETGLGWKELLLGADTVAADATAIEAARVLLQENQQLRDENEHLRRQLEHASNRVPQTPASFHQPRSNGEKIETALAWTRWLSDWEREFVTNIAGRPRLSPKQQDCLDLIISKIAHIARGKGLAA